MNKNRHWSQYVGLAILCVGVAIALEHLARGRQLVLLVVDLIDALFSWIVGS